VCYRFIDALIEDIIYVIGISLYNNIIDAFAWDIERFHNETVDSRNTIWTSRMRTRIILAIFREEFIKRSQYVSVLRFLSSLEKHQSLIEISIYHKRKTNGINIVVIQPASVAL